MLITRMLGQRHHLEYCYNFVQFESFGTMIFSQAIELLDEGLIDIESVSILPFLESFTVIRLTGKGRRFEKNS